MKTYLWSLGLIVAACVLVGLGARKMSIAMKNSEPLRMAYDQWLAQKPDHEWLSLEGVHVEWSAAVRIDTQHKRRGVTTSTTSEYFVACWKSEEDEGPIHCFLVFDDADKSAFIDKAIDASNNKDEAWLKQNESKLSEVLTVEGLVRTGMDLSSDDERLLRKAGNVAAQFRIVDVGKTPQGGMGGLLILGGMVAFAGGIAWGVSVFRHNKKRKAARPVYPLPAHGQYPAPSHPPYPAPGAPGQTGQGSYPPPPYPPYPAPPGPSLGPK